VRLVASVAVSPVFVPLFVVPGPTKRLAGSVFLWIGTAALSDAEISALMVRYFRGRFTDRTLCCAEAVRCLQHHVSLGHRVLIVTGAAEPAARHVCREIGLPTANLEFVGSTVRRAFGGWIGHEHCSSRAKVVMLKRGGIDRADVVYTDSPSDLPMLKMAGRRVLVNPSKWAEFLVSSALGSHVETVRWA
jgi:phosphatidylglycerophosphatase C